MMKILKLALSVVVCTQAAVLNCYAEGAGSSACLTLLQPISAKTAGVGEAYTAVSGEVVSLHYNPAGLASMKNLEIATMFQKGLDEDNFASLVCGKNLSFGTVAASIQYYDTGKIEMFDTNGVEISKVGQKDIILNVGAGIPIGEKLSAGANVKAISSEIFGEKASAFAMDMGAQYKELLSNIDFGITLRNAGTKLTYVDEGEKLPMNARLGAAYTKEIGGSRLQGTVDFPYYINEKETLGLLGIEYILNNLIAFRGGYRMNLSNSSSDDEQNINAGIGFMWSSFSIDYAIGLTDDLDNPHHISVNMRF